MAASVEDKEDHNDGSPKHDSHEEESKSCERYGPVKGDFLQDELLKNKE